MSRTIAIHTERWAARTPFSITGRIWHSFDPVICEIAQGEAVGRGEGLSVHYRGETPETMQQQLEQIRGPLSEGADRHDLLELLPPGGARNAADAALWDLEAQTGCGSAWSRAGATVDAIETVFSIGMEDEPARMAEKARAAARYTRLKIKLDGNRPLEKITAIRAARPDAQLVIDANQGWTFAQLQDLTAPLARLGVAMIEQPLPRGEDDVLAGYDSAIALCADESCLHGGELDDAIARYQMVNIKLDKCGGLTAALALAGQVRAAGLRMMVGCMGGTSLAMAPAHVLAQLCDLVDIDGPLLLRNDRHGGLIYDGGRVTLPAKPIWGTAR